MLKRFLKFFKGDGQGPEERFEGSYLDHLLAQVHPTTVEQLEECPEHDPLLLVVVGILRSTMINVWNPRLRCPLADSQSPGMGPPPPPAVIDTDNPSAESDSTDEFDAVEEPADEGAEASEDELEAPPATDGEDEAVPHEDDAEADDQAAPESSEDDADEPADQESAESDLEPSGDAADETEEGGEAAADDAADEEARVDEADPDENASVDEADAASNDDSGEEPDAEDDDEVMEVDEEELEEFGPPPKPSSSRITEEIDVRELRAAHAARVAQEEEEQEEEEQEEEEQEEGQNEGQEEGQELELAQETSAASETFEKERYVLDHTETGLDPTIEIEKGAIFEEQAADARPRIDTEEVLQAGRVFLGLLIENDRLPTDLQLTVAETTIARDLLLGYFVGNDDFEDRAKQLLALVEQKFGEGLFSQARILLQLFHTDEQTRVNNDRNLFYEDMILRLGIRRRHRMSEEELETYQRLATEARDGRSVRELSEWLDEQCHIKLHFFVRDPRQVAIWNDVAGRSTRPSALENFLRYLPPRRWRPVHRYDGFAAREQLDEHVSIDTARSYVIAQLKTCYFVLRAVGDTGLEGYLDSFFDWTEQNFDLNGTLLMPELYKRSMMDTEPMNRILRSLYDEHFAAGTEAKLDALRSDDVDRAFDAALAQLVECDLGAVPPGYYDLGGLIYDQIFGMSYPAPEFAFKIHRLT